MPSFRFSSWFLEHPSSSSIGPLSGALIWPGDRAPPWLQVVPCPGAARDEGVFLLLGWRVGLWLPRALSTLRDEGIRILWYNCNLFLTCSPYWQLCVNQNLAVLIVSNTSMQTCIRLLLELSFPCCNFRRPPRLSSKFLKLPETAVGFIVPSSWTSAWCLIWLLFPLSCLHRPAFTSILRSKKLVPSTVSKERHWAPRYCWIYSYTPLLVLLADFSLVIHTPQDGWFWLNYQATL